MDGFGLFHPSGVFRIVDELSVETGLQHNWIDLNIEAPVV